MQIFICPGAVPEGKAWGYILKNSKFLVFCLRHSLGHGLRASKNLNIPTGYTSGLIKICIFLRATLQGFIAESLA
ncbi:hypothetical protein T4D_10801 [Trichinella pseudospiralis]|uniref:Uncharacterized protein n=1 Tax=Trichinella pseudospiralis TaxID=6337 RepID=A0A0V1FJJ8_TRIPS|nr:hypothetical protein T4D_10801 [Trichinella pseudospiralis]